MRYIRTALVSAGTAAVVVAGLAVPATTAATSSPRMDGSGAPLGPPSTTVTDWARVALSTVYPARSVPDGALYLGFTSLAVYDAVLTAKSEHPQHGWVSARAAAATAAHDVLFEYFPASAATLDAALEDSLDSLPDGAAKDAGVAVGEKSADDMIASRVGDGRNDPAITFTEPEAIGIWRPTLPNNLPMALPWLGHVKPLVLDSPTQIRPDGPDLLTSSDYAADYNEVRTTGAAEGSTRTEDETTTAKFFNANVVLQVQSALLALLDDRPLGMVKTARLFALTNASVADGLITTWRLKLDEGYWRPITAIHMADEDDNDGTTADTEWAPLIDTLGGTPAGTPPYPEYPSGHATGLNAMIEALTLTTGTSDTDLTLSSSVTSTTKHYSDLCTLSRDGFLARIWLGIHFRDAMEDARYVGQQAARLVDSRLP